MSCSTALPRCLLTRKRSQVQTLSRPPRPPLNQGFVHLLAPAVGRDRWARRVGEEGPAVGEHITFEQRCSLGEEPSPSDGS